MWSYYGCISFHSGGISITYTSTNCIIVQLRMHPLPISRKYSASNACMLLLLLLLIKQIFLVERSVPAEATQGSVGGAELKLEFGLTLAIILDKVQMKAFYVMKHKVLLLVLQFQVQRATQHKFDNRMEMQVRKSSDHCHLIKIKLTVTSGYNLLKLGEYSTHILSLDCAIAINILLPKNCV